MNRFLSIIDPLRPSTFARRRGVSLVLGLAAVVGALGFVLLGVESSVRSLTLSQRQGAVDAAALAAAWEIASAIHHAATQIPAEHDARSKPGLITVKAAEAARATAVRVAGARGLALDGASDVEFGRRLLDLSQPDGERTAWGQPPYNIVRVTARGENENRALPVVTATAAIDSRDVVVVMDYSGSMNDDSTFSKIGSLGQRNVEENMKDIFDVLDELYDFGRLEFTPQYFTATRESGDLEATATFRNTAVSIHANGELVAVQLRFSDGTMQSFDGLSGDKGTFTGSGPQAGKSIDSVWIELQQGGNGQVHAARGPARDPMARQSSSGRATATLRFDDSTEEVVRAFGLDAVRWPWPSGSWNDFVDKCRVNLDIKRAGYQRMYGGACLVHYLLAYKERYSRCPDLWRTPHYPFHACKNGLTGLLNFLDELGLGDEGGLVSYATWAVVERELNDRFAPKKVSLGDDWITGDFQKLDQIQRHKQAGHFASTTAIGDGLKQVRELLASHGRRRAHPTILLMTDGLANVSPRGFTLPAGWNWAALTDYDGDGRADFTSDNPHKQYAFYQAKLAIDAGCTIHTLSVGADADRPLMKAIAFAAGGQWLDVPGGSTVGETETEVRTAFSKIAGAVPAPRLVGRQGAD